LTYVNIQPNFNEVASKKIMQVKKMFFGALWFVVLWFGMTVIVAGTAGSIAAANNSGLDSSASVGAEAGDKAQDKYGTTILLGSAAMALAGTIGEILPGTKKTNKN
jgi:hypothetical protein